MFSQSDRYGTSCSISTSLRSTNFLIASATALCSVAIVALPSSALSVQERYDLCSKYPHNSQCEGYEIPTPLERRSGTQGKCQLQLEGKTVEDTCKVEATEDNINVYVEIGDNIELLDNKRATTEISVPSESVSRLSYSEGTRVSKALQAANALSLFGQALQIAGGGRVSSSAPRSARIPVAKVSIQFDLADSLPSHYNSLTFESDLRQGIEFRDDVRNLTGLPSYSLSTEEAEISQ